MSVRTSWLVGLCLLPASTFVVASDTPPSIVTPVSESHSASTAGVLRLADALAFAMRDNPGLAAMRSRATAAAAVPGQVSVLPDPRLLLNAANLPLDGFSMTQEGMTQLQVGVVQMLVAIRRLDLREKVATYESAAAADDVGEMRLRL